MHYEKPEAYTQIQRKARKSHVCIECNGRIQPGEHYTDITGIWDSRPARYRICAICMTWVESALDVGLFDVWLFGELALEIASVTKKYDRESPGDHTYYEVRAPYDWNIPHLPLPTPLPEFLRQR